MAESDSPAPRMTFSALVEEVRSHGGDVSGFAGLEEGAALTVPMLKALLKATATMNETIMSEMDACTSIGKVPMAWGETSLSWAGVNFKVKDNAGNERAILKDCWGHVPAGSLTAVMGPSGCGKSTLLDILAQKKTTPFEGEVYCNGHKINGDKFFKRYACYVPQSDNMHEVLTVKETILFNFALKSPVPKNMSSDPELKDIIPDLFLSILGLRGVKDTIIGGDKSGLRGVSGGQKRRVTLARGAISGAQLLFADEPTSGLSATDAETCIKMLRFLCKRLGLTCLVVIHQPRVEVTELFDNLILLTSDPDKFGASTVYNGPMSDVVDYCSRAGYPVPERANPADWIMDVVTPGYKHVLVKRGQKEVDESVRDFVAFYLEKRAPELQTKVRKQIGSQGQHPRELAYSKWEHIQDYLTPEAAKLFPKRREGSVHGTPFGTQFLILLLVKLRLLLRDKKGLRMRMGMSIMQGLVVGLAFQDIASKPQLSHIQYFFMAMQLSAVGGMQIMPGMVDLRTVMRQDVDEGLHSTGAWICANCLIDAVLTIVTNTMFIFILYAFGGMDWDMFGTFYVWVLLCILVMDSYYNFIAAVAPTGATATVMSMPIMILFVLFNGFIVSKTSVPKFMEWALYVSPFFYSISSLAMAMYGPDACSDAGCALVIRSYSFDEAPSEEVAVVVLLCLTGFFRALQVLALATLNKAQK